jgi:hypothetical protein
MIDFNGAPLQGEWGNSTIDVDGIRDRLHADVKGFVEHIYSGRAFCTKTDARIGSVEGEPGESLSISLRTGQWYDFATGESGDLIDLYRLWAGYPAARDVDFVLSLKEIARDFLGDSIEFEPRFWKPSTQDRIKQQKEKLGDKPRSEDIELGAPVGIWTYVDADGKIIAKVERYEPDGTPESKTYRPFCHKKQDDGTTRWGMGAPEIRPLYNLPALIDAKHVVLVEGEKCAAALIGQGIIATTAMQGAKAPVDKTDWSVLAGKKITIWPDNDTSGLEYAKAVSIVLRDMRCEVLGVDIPAGKKKGWDCADCILEGGDVHPLLAKARPVFDEKVKSRFYAYDLNEVSMRPRPKYLIDGMLVERTISMIWGPPGCMKTFVALDMALCIATGMAWHGKAVVSGPALYIAAEGSFNVGQRAYGWWKNRGKDLREMPNFKMIPIAVSITHKPDFDALLAQLQAMPAMPSIIILDTLARTFGEGNENTQEDMNKYVATIGRIIELTGAHVMVVHHSGVGEAARERGSNVMRAATETVLKIDRDGERIDVVSKQPSGRQKEALEAETVMLRAAQVSFIWPADNEEMTTIVLNDVEDDEADSVAATRKARQTGDGSSLRPGLQKKVYDYLKSTGKSASREEIRTACRISIDSISPTISRLLKKGLIVEDGRNVPDGVVFYKVSE